MLSGGQNWTRVYARDSGFPQVIHSTKRFSGSTGLEEYIGHGIRMALTLSVENGTLVFTSAGYFIDCGGFCFRLPHWLAPGKTVVTHSETTGNEFLFTLELSHPLFGTLIRQEALYSEVQHAPAHRPDRRDRVLRPPPCRTFGGHRRHRTRFDLAR